MVPKRMAAFFALFVAAGFSCARPALAAEPEALQYKPPTRGAPSARVGGGTRSVQFPVRQVAAVLAPDHTGLTTREQPTLCWYLSQPAPVRVELAPVGGQAANPLLELALASPSSAGVQKLDLARYGVRLQTGPEYRWSVSVESGALSRASSGMIQRIAPSPELARSIDGAPKSAHAAIFAEAGIWYDAIASISEMIDASPGDAALRVQRASLLEQVGLKEAAEGDLKR